MPRMQVTAIHLSSWTADIIFVFSLRKTLIFTFDRKQLISYQRNYKNWWPFAKKTSITLKSFRNKLTIKAGRATSPVTKFDWITNTSKPNKIGNLSPVFQTIPSIISCRQTSLQTQIHKIVEDIWCFSCVTTRAEYH